jgi:hypothetical protein
MCILYYNIIVCVAPPAIRVHKRTEKIFFLGSVFGKRDELSVQSTVPKESLLVRRLGPKKNEPNREKPRFTVFGTHP